MLTVLLPIVIIGAVAILLAIATMITRRRGYSGIGGDTIVVLLAFLWANMCSVMTARTAASR